MSEPAWIPLGGAVGGDVVYEGGWSAATAYQPGDVVTYQGVQFIAVLPSTNQTPPVAVAGIPYSEKAAASGVASLGSDGKVPLAQSQFPSPLVNGKWLGVKGGAMLWDTLQIMLGDVFDVQYGQTNVNITAGTATTYTLVLPRAWPSAQIAFIAQGWPGGSWAGFATIASIPSGLTGGSVAFNSTNAQVVTVSWASFGY